MQIQILQISLMKILKSLFANFIFLSKIKRKVQIHQKEFIWNLFQMQQIQKIKLIEAKIVFNMTFFSLFSILFQFHLLLHVIFYIYSITSVFITFNTNDFFLIFWWKISCHVVLSKRSQYKPLTFRQALLFPVCCI